MSTSSSSVTRTRPIWRGLILGLLAFATLGFGVANEVRLIVGLPEDKTSLDIADVGESANDFGLIVFDRLVGFTAEGTFVPELATSWEVSDDGLTWTFELREGQRFHDGTPVNAEAVKYTFDRLRDPDEAFLRAAVFDRIAEVRVLDDYTVAFDTTVIHPFMLNTVADTSASIVSPTAAEELGRDGFAANPVGSGPYRFVSWERGNRLVFEKNPDHWLADASNVDVIEMQIIPDLSSRAIGLETGAIHFATRTSPAEAARLDALPNLVAYNVPLVRNLAINGNLTKEPFTDVRVRHAIAHAIDRELIIDAFMDGYARVADSVFTPGVWSYTPQPVFEYDPDRARELLAEAGYADGFDTKLRVPTGRLGGIIETAEAVSQMLGDVGINVELELVEHATFIVLMREPPETADHELSFWNWGTLTGEPDYAVRLQFLSDNWSPACCNRNFYKNERVDELIRAGLVAVDESERLAIYQEIQEIVWSEQGHIPLLDYTHTSVGRADVTGVGVMPTERWDFRTVNVGNP